MAHSKPSANSPLSIDTPPIAEGRERSCYRHPQDDSKVVKIPRGDETSQTLREKAFYENLQKRGITDYSHLPRYFGMVDTNLGPGLVTELIRDHDGSISRSLNWYIEYGLPREEVEIHFRELKKYLLQHLIIFNHDLNSGNMLLRKGANDHAGLVIIDGLGDVIAIPWLNHFSAHARRKIERRWRRLMTRFYKHNYLPGRQPENR